MEQIKIVVIVNKELVVVAGIKPATYLAAMITTIMVPNLELYGRQIYRLFDHN